MELKDNRCYMVVASHLWPQIGFVYCIFHLVPEVLLYKTIDVCKETAGNMSGNICKAQIIFFFKIQVID